MTLDEFNPIFNLLIANYPNTKHVEDLASLYYLVLSTEITKEQFHKAMIKLVKTRESDFIPKPAEIIKIAKEKTNVERQIIHAKRLLKTALIKCGKTGLVSFEDQGVHAVIDQIGWLRLCNMTEVEFENFLNFQFDVIYKNFIENPYATTEYYRGLYQLVGQTAPEMITYASIGLNPSKLEFIALGYKSNPEKSIDYSKLKNNLLIGR